MIRDIIARIQGKQRCVLFSSTYIPLEVIKQYKKIFDKNYMLSKTDPEGKVTFVNSKFLANHGIDEDEILGETHRVVKCEKTPPRLFKDMWRTIKAGHKWHGVMSYAHSDGKMSWNSVNIFPIFDKKGNIVEYVALRNDVTDIKELEHEIEESQKELIVTLGAVIESKEGNLHNHIIRVSEFSYLLAKKLGLSERECELLKMASPMHDVGKVGIPDAILNKPARLNDEEYEVMKTHAKIGHDIFKASNLELLKVAATISHHHHEKWDGTGYPQGLKGEQISIYGRITALADVYDALASKRVYKDIWSEEDIDALIFNERGKHFDPDVVDCYFHNKDKFKEILEMYED